MWLTLQVISEHNNNTLALTSTTILLLIEDFDYSTQLEKTAPKRVHTLYVRRRETTAFIINFSVIHMHTQKPQEIEWSSEGRLGEIRHCVSTSSAKHIDRKVKQIVVKFLIRHRRCGVCDCRLIAIPSVLILCATKVE